VTRSFFAVMPRVTQTRAAIAFHAHLRRAIECETALSAEYAAQ